ncbi:hypothetical protein TUM3794_16050 [Shewanella colwelliana]|uniref:Uncharacterized protein n=1 Tax=Shewanella colwelliana TaxID=23 RepID=A0ABQ4NZ38_SHECO|nr:hypothetical protein TUM3794_16050 [Shewanella colwelliana]
MLWFPDKFGKFEKLLSTLYFKKQEILKLNHTKSSVCILSLKLTINWKPFWVVWLSLTGH